MQAPRASTPSSPWPAPSPVTVFLRNIHLLQLDQQQDWPGLSRKLFSGGQKVQTQRVKSVEWVLYHLFLLWSPSEAKNKLRPFFPPLEPLQSVNLRAALFRALSELKKNGDLGRETTVRKTMLDDCKGPKFEEILAVFSTAVLRKVAHADHPHDFTFRLASARSLTENEVEDGLIPLIIAHHADLSRKRRTNTRIRESHRRFGTLLEEKAKELSARSKRKVQVNEDPLHSESLAHDVKANWLGSQHLVEALFNGGSAVEKDSLLELPFEQAWYHARQGDIDNLSRPSHVDLLQNMQAYSSKQRDRIQRFKEMKTSESPAEQASRVQATTNPHSKNQGLSFRDHQTLTVAGTSKSLRERVESRNLFAEHEAILSSLRTAISEVKGIRAQQTEHFSSHSPATLVEPPLQNQSKNPIALSPIQEPIPDTENMYPSLSPSPSVQITDYEDEKHTKSTNSITEHPHTQPYNYVGGFEDASSLGAYKRDVHIPSNSAHEDEPTTLSHPQFEPRPSSLLERTRQSMSLLPPPSSSRSRQSLAARRETRQSQYFPINQFDTPPKEEQEPPSRSGASTPRDELFSEEAEYASIFKSRPRVAHSPLMSPAVHVGFDHDADEEYVGDSDSILDLAVDGSPLAMKKR